MVGMEMSEHFKFAVRMQNELERQRIVSMFEVMAPQLEDQWQQSSANEANVVLLDADAPGSEYFLESCREMAGAVPVLIGRQNPLTSEWFLEMPVRVCDIVSLLNYLGQYLRTRGHQARDRQLRHRENQDCHRVRRMFENMAAQPGSYRIDITPSYRLFYNSEEDKILLPRELLVTGNHKGAFGLLAHSIRQRSMTAIAPERFRTISRDQRYAKISREALIWNWTLAKDPESAAAPSTTQRYHLNHWPNLTGVPHTASHLKLCQYFSEHTATIIEAADATHVAVNTVHAFCNACETLGLMTAAQADDYDNQQASA